MNRTFVRSAAALAAVALAAGMSACSSGNDDNANPAPSGSGSPQPTASPTGVPSPTPTKIAKNRYGTRAIKALDEVTGKDFTGDAAKPWGSDNVAEAYRTAVYFMRDVEMNDPTFLALEDATADRVSSILEPWGTTEFIEESVAKFKPVLASYNPSNGSNDSEAGKALGEWYTFGSYGKLDESTLATPQFQYKLRGWGTFDGSKDFPKSVYMILDANQTQYGRDDEGKIVEFTQSRTGIMLYLIPNPDKEAAQSHPWLVRGIFGEPKYQSAFDWGVKPVVDEKLLADLEPLIIRSPDSK